MVSSKNYSLKKSASLLKILNSSYINVSCGLKILKMRKVIIAIISLFLITVSCTKNLKEFELASGPFKLTINHSGFVSGFFADNSGENFIATDTLAPLMTVRLKNELLFPEKAVYDKEKGFMNLYFNKDIEAKVKIEAKKTHITFELVSITNAENIDLIIWGPYPLTLNKSIGETVGIVSNENFTFGIQALNPKTLGGYPWNENDCMPQIDIFEQDNLSDMSEKGKRGVLYRVEAAKPADFGSTLQAYCRNRDHSRLIQNWSHEKYTAPAFDDEGIIGSKIAIFGCSVDNTLESIGNIEIAEGLPHPLIDGIWGKQSKGASAAYLIMGFGEHDIDQALAITKKAGLKYLYHPGPFEYWGHFKLKEGSFPDGVESMKRCVEKAKKQGIMLGVHTLSNFITTNDPYVTPVPDKRLAKVGSSTLSQALNLKQTEIFIESPEFFSQFKNNNLRTVMVGDELIRYGAVSETTPWKLMDCQRGAYGTKIASHKKGKEISILADHAYKVFLTDTDLSMEVSKNIAELFNKTGLRQVSFDGLEGNRSTGMGNYGEILFTNAWYNNLINEIKQHFIADASRTSHYFWHIYTRMNWGEPWYAGFRESQTDYRMKNQKYFKRNLMPGMLGWFSLSSGTSVEDIEWMLARSAAFDAGYGFSTSYKTLAENGNTEKILQLLGEWEKARMAGAFTKSQKENMEDIQNEFSLEPLQDKTWNLYQVFSYKFNYKKKEKQPGEPIYDKYEFNNPAVKQAMGFILTAKDGNISAIKLEIDNYKELNIPVSLSEGQHLKYVSGNSAVIYNKSWHRIKEIPMDGSKLVLSPGDHSLSFECSFSGGKEPNAGLEIRVKGKAEKITGK